MTSGENAIDLFRCSDEECHAHTGLYLKEIFILLGIFGVHPFFNYKNHLRRSTAVYDLKYKKIKVTIRTEFLEIFQVDILPNLKKIKINAVKRTNNAPRGIAFRLIVSMVNRAYELGFKKIGLHAASGFGFDGYVVWGLLGFIPWEQSVLEEFEEIKFEYCHRTGKLPPDTLYDLLICPEGRILWAECNLNWSGDFEIADNSPSVNILRREIQRQKGLGRESTKLFF